jgi:hypothetical protein
MVCRGGGGNETGGTIERNKKWAVRSGPQGGYIDDPEPVIYPGIQPIGNLILLWAVDKKQSPPPPTPPPAPPPPPRLVKISSLPG